jgi:hypothetical protein
MTHDNAMTLGTGVTTAHFYDRGGTVPFFNATKLMSYRWNRVRDGISEARVLVNSDGPIARDLAKLSTSRHELVLERDGRRIWEGPITKLAYRPTHVEIEAKDVWHYAQKAIMRSRYNNAYPNIIAGVTRVQNILTTELARFEALTPPINVLPYLDVRVLAGTAKTSRSTRAYQRMVWEEIDEMAAKGGIDYTCVGRSMLVFDVDDVIGRTVTLSDADFLDDLIVTEYGMELATYSAVTDGNGHWGAFGGTDSIAGLWEILESTYDQTESANIAPTQTTAEMKRQARRNMSGRFPAPVVLRVPDGATLSPTSSVTVNDLVPGVRVPLRSNRTARKITQEQKLDKVVVEGSEGHESFKVTLSPAPAGNLPWDDSDEVSSD